MDSLYSPSRVTIGPQSAFFPASNWSEQPEPPFNSHTFFPPVNIPKEPRKYVAEDWETQRSEITRLYEHNTLESVRLFMREQHGLDATPKQYKDRIRKWGLDKNIKTAEMEAIIRKQRDRALTSNKASAFRVRKRPVNQGKIDRYIIEHPKRQVFNADTDVEMNMDSAATPAGISVYTPSNTGPRTPLASPSPRENSHEYTAASPQHLFSPRAQNATPYQYDNLNPQTPDPPSIQSNPALFATLSTPYLQMTSVSMGSPASIAPNLQSPSPALSISSIIRPTTSTFTGQSPAITPRTLPLLSQISASSTVIRQDQTRPTLSNLSSSAAQTRTEPDVTTSAKRRYKQDEEENLRIELFIAETVLGESDLEYLNISRRLAGVLSEQGRYRSAEEVIRKSISAYKEENGGSIGKYHALSILGVILNRQGLYTQAEKNLIKVIRGQTELLGSEHPNTLSSMASLTHTYWSQDRLEEAEELQVQVLEARTRVSGEEHPDTLISMSGLASIYWSQKRWKKAEELQIQIIEGRKRVYGEEHSDTLSSIHNLAATYWSQMRWEEAEELEVQVVETKTRVLGGEHPNTLLSMYNLAHTWKKCGRRVDAIKVMQACVEKQTRVLGSDHPDTLSSCTSLHKWQGEN